MTIMTMTTNAPHETPFQYDDALLSSCASSPLARSLIIRGERDEAGGRAASHTPLRHRRGGLGGDCRALFERHAAHYRRPPLSVEERRFWGRALAADETSNAATADGGDRYYSEGGMSPRTEAFLHSVAFVHVHNNARGKRGHRVALNRFSDVPSHELPLMSHGGDDASSFFDGRAGDFNPLEATLDNLLPLHSAAEYLNAFPKNDQGVEGSNKQQSQPMFVPLGNHETIIKFGEEIRRARQRRSSYGGLPAVTAAPGSEFPTVGGAWWWVGGDHADRRARKRIHDHVGDRDGPVSRHDKGKTKDGSFLLDEHAGLEKNKGADDDVPGDDWDGYLNWATGDNPDGVPVVHEAMDQGLCGSCWAISALGTLEASIARNMAYSAYEEAFSSGSSSSSGADPRDLAVLAARLVERQSIRTADLSVQELVDCDTRYDQGCAGGNPLLAFYFLHRFGVTSSANYPYTGTMGACRYDKVDQPVASVATWGILTPDHENNMEKVLRYIGPVAVGMIGEDPEFLSYAGGIFTSSKGGKCDVGQADHALLITGYGQELSEDGAVQKYWIARNSWGTGWGENGYARIARSSGKKGHRGVCGIARSPSVALGGMFTSNVELDKNDLYESTRSGKRANTTGDGGRPDDSIIARASSQIQSVLHRIRTRLGLLQKGIVMSTNNGSEYNSAVRPFGMAVGMLICVLSLAQMYRIRRRGCRGSGSQRDQSHEEESVATNWSTAGVHNGVRESIGHESGSQSSVSDGERMHLLATSSGPLYT